MQAAPLPQVPYKIFGIVQIVSMFAFGVLWAISFVGIAMCSDGGNIGYCEYLFRLWIASGIAAVVAMALAIPMLIYSRPSAAPAPPLPTGMRICLIASVSMWMVVLAFVMAAFSPIPQA